MDMETCTFVLHFGAQFHHTIKWDGPDQAESRKKRIVREKGEKSTSWYCGGGDMVVAQPNKEKTTFVVSYRTYAVRWYAKTNTNNEHLTSLLKRYIFAFDVSFFRHVFTIFPVVLDLVVLFCSFAAVTFWWFSISAILDWKVMWMLIKGSW